MDKKEPHVNIDFVIGFTSELARQLNSANPDEREIARKYVGNRICSLLAFLHQIRNQENNQ